MYFRVNYVSAYPTFLLFFVVEYFLKIENCRKIAIGTVVALINCVEILGTIA